MKYKLLKIKEFKDDWEFLPKILKNYEDIEVVEVPLKELRYHCLDSMKKGWSEVFTFDNGVSLINNPDNSNKNVILSIVKCVLLCKAEEQLE